MGDHEADTKTSSPDNAAAHGNIAAPAARSTWWWLSRIITASLFLGTGVLLIVLIGVAQRLGWIRSGSGSATSAAAADSQIYTCPMHPQIRQPGPGRCPICGMDLEVSASGGADLDEFSVSIEPAQRRLAQIQTAAAQRTPVSTEIRSIGSIAIDESRMATISSYVAGRIERLFADYTGVDLAKGDHLTVIYSPQLFAAQVDYLEARKALAGVSPGALDIVRQTQAKLASSTRQRLVELGMTDEQIAELDEGGEAQSRLTIYAPIGGTVTEKLLVEGDYVDAGQPIYRMANLTTVWLMLELFPEDASRIRFGQKVTAEVQSLPGEVFQGRVAFIDPTINERKRTAGVRVEFWNEDRRLRPGDYASAVITVPIGAKGEVYDAELAGKWISPMHPQIIRDEPGQCPICGMDLVETSRYGYSNQPVAQPESLVIPRSAVLLAGDSSVVYVETEPGRFQIRPITLGPFLRDRVIVIDGLKEGELVATAGNFLIDSQMQLAGKPSLIDPTRAIAAKKARNTPLEIADADVRVVEGEAGQKLEQLYQAYFRVQSTLASDQPPVDADAVQMRELATELFSNPEFTGDEAKLLQTIATNSEHLAHLPIEEARLKAFRPISHAIVTLAATHRGEGADAVHYQMFCPMVKGGEGDWLQPTDKLRNPYWGSRMLKCGDIVREFPPRGSADGGDNEGQKAESSTSDVKEQ